jgi:GT2 family glycosyltransferase
MYVNHGMYLKSALDVVGYIDEENYFFYNADGDLCLKLWQQGYQVLDSPDSYVEHYPHANINVRKTNYIKFNQDLKNYLNKWQGIYYDPVGNNLGKIIEKMYNDPYQTALKLESLHDGVVKKNPAVLKNKSFFIKTKDQLKWKYKAAIRKIGQRFGILQ